MKKWTKDSLEAAGYKIENARITDVSLNMEDHGVLTSDLTLDGGGWGACYGGYVLGKGYLELRSLKALPLAWSPSCESWMLLDVVNLLT